MAIKARGEEALALLLLDAKIPFQREYKFHIVRKWRFDFVIGHHPLNTKIAIEIEGGVFSHGRHTRGSGYVKDCEKLNSVRNTDLYDILKKETEVLGG